MCEPAESSAPAIPSLHNNLWVEISLLFPHTDSYDAALGSHQRMLKPLCFAGDHLSIATCSWLAEAIFEREPTASNDDLLPDPG
jgi:hypothetical protein